LIVAVMIIYVMATTCREWWFIEGNHRNMNDPTFVKFVKDYGWLEYDSFLFLAQHIFRCELLVLGMVIEVVGSMIS